MKGHCSIEELLLRYPALNPIQNEIALAATMLTACYQHGGKLLIAGNGGSSADAEHITGELLKGFLSKRPLPEALKTRLSEVEPTLGGRLAGALQQGLDAVNLAGAQALGTAFANDVEPEFVFAQHLLAAAQPNDLFLGISTGGGAKNVYAALVTARALQLPTILLTGAKHGCCEALADCCVRAPETETYRIQELHLPIYHYWCAQVEEVIYG